MENYKKKDFRKLYEDLVNSDWFKKVYHDKSLGECPIDIPELRESEDEKIRKEIVSVLKFANVEGVYDKHIAYLEKQKDVSEALEAAERIENYITEHTANSWEMDDSNPDKKYYCGVDDTLADIDVIVKDVYAKHKEQKPLKVGENAYFDPNTDMWFIKKEQNPVEWSEEEAKKAAEDYADEFPGMTHESDGSTIEDYDKPYNDFMAGVLWAKHQCIFQNGNAHRKSSEEQKPVEWSEDIIRKAVKEVGLTQHQIDWFKTNVFPPKQEWSEEEKKVIADSHEQLIRFANSWERGGNPDNADAVRKIASKLKSLRPQPKWKPSKEQMEALGMARELGRLSIQHQEYLYNLENDLKKLMEE